MTRHRKKKKHVSEHSPEIKNIPVHHAPLQATRAEHRAPAKESAQSKKIAWRAAEFHYFEKDYLWYTGVVAVGVALLGLAIWQKNFFFAVFVVVATTLVVEFGKRKPRTLDYELNEKEVLIDNKMSIPYKSIESFHIHKRLGLLDELVFKRTARVNPFIHLPIDEELAIRAREFLLEYIIEDEHDQSFADILAERIRF